jgi:hypothetical protein
VRDLSRRTKFTCCPWMVVDHTLHLLIIKCHEVWSKQISSNVIVTSYNKCEGGKAYTYVSKIL